MKWLRREGEGDQEQGGDKVREYVRESSMLWDEGSLLSGDRNTWGFFIRVHLSHDNGARERLMVDGT